MESRLWRAGEDIQRDELVMLDENGRMVRADRADPRLRPPGERSGFASGGTIPADTSAPDLGLQDGISPPFRGPEEMPTKRAFEQTVGSWKRPTPYTDTVQSVADELRLAGALIGRNNPLGRLCGRATAVIEDLYGRLHGPPS